MTKAPVIDWGFLFLDEASGNGTHVSETKKGRKTPPLVLWINLDRLTYLPLPQGTT